MSRNVFFFLVHNEPWLYLKINIDVNVWRFSLQQKQTANSKWGWTAKYYMSNNIQKALLKSLVSFNKTILGECYLGKIAWKHAEICIGTEYLVLLKEFAFNSATHFSADLK